MNKITSIHIDGRDKVVVVYRSNNVVHYYNRPTIDSLMRLSDYSWEHNNSTTFLAMYTIVIRPTNKKG